MPQLTPANIDHYHILLKNYANCMVGAGEKQEGKSYTATDFLALNTLIGKQNPVENKEKQEAMRKTILLLILHNFVDNMMLR